MRSAKEQCWQGDFCKSVFFLSSLVKIVVLGLFVLRAVLVLDKQMWPQFKSLIGEKIKKRINWSLNEVDFTLPETQYHHVPVEHLPGIHIGRKYSH